MAVEEGCTASSLMQVRMNGPLGAPSRHHVRRLLNRLGLSPRKALGQHFLVSKRVQQHIINAAELNREDVVVEVGPGLGVLTRELAREARRVTAVELDAELARALAREFAGDAAIRVIQADARTIGYDQLLEGETRYKVVANLPYYAANPIVRRFLESVPKPEFMVIMVQREVARNMAAPPGRMGLLGVSVQFYARPRIVCYVPPRAFHPPPRVSSAVVRLDVREHPAVEVDDVGGFFHLVRAGFSAPRKQLRNALARGLDITTGEAQVLLGQAGLDHRRRAQSLTLEEWGSLYHVFSR